MIRALSAVLFIIALPFLAMLDRPAPALAQSYDYLVRPLFGLTNSAQTIKATPGTLLWISCVNPNATAVFIQVFDSAGAVTVGTTAAKVSLRVAPTSSTGFVSPIVTGPLFAAAGLQAAATLTASGASAPTTGVPCDFAVR